MELTKFLFRGMTSQTARKQNIKKIVMNKVVFFCRIICSHAPCATRIVFRRAGELNHCFHVCTVYMIDKIHNPFEKQKKIHWSWFCGWFYFQFLQNKYNIHRVHRRSDIAQLRTMMKWSRTKTWNHFQYSKKQFDVWNATLIASHPQTCFCCFEFNST